ncbi:WD-repeat protein, putative, partial [Ixodes scapularis]
LVQNYFILSSSMDKTVRLWHISSRECLCCFQHVDFVTAIAFHPRDDRYFLSGSLDGKLRLWNIPDKKVALWNELDGQTKLITAANFCQNGKFAVVGSYDGRCVFYNTEVTYYSRLRFFADVLGSSKRGYCFGALQWRRANDKILVTSNDSRIRLYDLRDLSLSCKYKGYVNLSSQIKGSFSHDGRYIISGSENQFIYIWKTYHDYKFSSARRDRNDYWEGIKGEHFTCFKKIYSSHNAVVTAAVFAPNPDAVLKQLDDADASSATAAPEGANSGGNYVIISADFAGTIKVFAKRPRAKAAS